MTDANNVEGTLYDRYLVCSPFYAKHIRTKISYICLIWDQKLENLNV